MNEEKKLTDFNDIHTTRSLDEVRSQIIPVKVELQSVHALGFKEAEYFFTSSSNRQVVGIKSINEETLSDLMPFEYWESVFPGTGKSLVNWSAARFKLKEQCRKVGIFQSRNIRGAGVWYDEGRIVVNMGDHLLVDGERVELGEIKSRFFYTLGITLKGLRSDPLSSEECDLLTQVCETFKWTKSDSPALLAGALVVSRVCGALPVRPHAWLTGGASTGKTTLLEKLIAPITGEPRLYVQGNTTEAGVRQSLKADAIPILFDEFETNGNGSAERVASVVELMRAAWSDSSAVIIKGGSSGNAISFQVRFAAIVSSIRCNLDNEADKARFAVLELAPHGSDQEHWMRLSELLAKIDYEYGDRLFARTVKMIPVLLANFKKIKVAMAKRSTQRFGDQYGMLLAGYSILLQDEPMDESQAEFLANQIKLEDERENAKDTDHNDALNLFLTKKVSVDASCGKEERLILEMLHDVNGENKSPYVTPLMRLGLIVKEDFLWIANNSIEFKTLFSNTKFQNSFIQTLERLPGAVRGPKNSASFFGKDVRCLKIPLETVFKNRTDTPPDTDKCPN